MLMIIIIIIIIALMITMVMIIILYKCGTWVSAIFSLLSHSEK